MFAALIAAPCAANTGGGWFYIKVQLCMAVRKTKVQSVYID